MRYVAPPRSPSAAYTTVDARARSAHDTFTLHPPRSVDAYLTERDWRDALAATYQDGSLSARTTPNHLAHPPLGTWRIDDTVGLYGREISCLTEVSLDTLNLPELTAARGLAPDKMADGQRYAQWFSRGYNPPPIEVIETDAGQLRVIDGHRRCWAGLHRQHEIVKAWVAPMTNHPSGERDAQGGPLRVGLTYELAQAGAHFSCSSLLDYHAVSWLSRIMTHSSGERARIMADAAPSLAHYIVPLPGGSFKRELTGWRLAEGCRAFSADEQAPLRPIIAAMACKQGAGVVALAQALPQLAPGADLSGVTTRLLRQVVQGQAHDAALGADAAASALISWQEQGHNLDDARAWWRAHAADVPWGQPDPLHDRHVAPLAPLVRAQILSGNDLAAAGPAFVTACAVEFDRGGAELLAALSLAQ